MKDGVKRLWNTLKNNVPQHQITKALQILSSTVHHIIKRVRETGEISVRKALSCKTETKCEHGPEAASCPVSQGSFKFDCFKLEK